MKLIKSGTNKRRIAVVGAFALAAAGPLAACGDDSDDASAGSDESAASDGITVSEPWARSGTAGGNVAIYMELTAGDAPEVLVGALVPDDIATTAEIHETTTDGGMATEDGDMSEGDTDSEGHGDPDSDGDMADDGQGGSGMMSMQEVDSITIPADGSVKLEPGGFHIMLFDLESDLVAGDSVDVTLVFGTGIEQTVTAEVRDA